MTNYKRFLPVMLVLAWLAVPTNAGQGAGTADPALESSAADSCVRLATAKVVSRLASGLPDHKLVRDISGEDSNTEAGSAPLLTSGCPRRFGRLSLPSSC
jgi:hypothetical protein